jgi:3-oxoacyl-[acyl-carrier protein] reductase
MSSTSMSYNHSAFVTGGGSGFGLAIAKKLLSTGSKVAIGDVNTDHLAQARDITFIN